jgi:hypothetical protein
MKRIAMLALPLIATGAVLAAPQSLPSCGPASWDQFAIAAGSAGCVVGPIRLSNFGFGSGTVAGPVISMSDLFVIPFESSGHAGLRVELAPAISSAAAFQGATVTLSFDATASEGGHIDGRSISLEGSSFTDAGFVRAADMQCLNARVFGPLSSLPQCEDADQNTWSPSVAMLFNDASGSAVSYETDFAPVTSVGLATRVLLNNPAGTANGTASLGAIVYTFNVSPPPVPTSVNSCKIGGWQTLRRADGSAFKNQGACVSYVNTRR